MRYDVIHTVIIYAIMSFKMSNFFDKSLCAKGSIRTFDPTSRMMHLVVELKRMNELFFRIEWPGMQYITRVLRAHY